jgi:hypothetical protein
MLMADNQGRGLVVFVGEGRYRYLLEWGRHGNVRSSACQHGGDGGHTLLIAFVPNQSSWSTRCLTVAPLILDRNGSS